MNISRTAQPTRLNYNPKTPKDKENDKKKANSDVKEAQPATTVQEDDVWMYMNAQARYQAVVVPPTKPTSKVEGAQLPPDDGNYTPPEYVGENPYEKNPKVEGAQLPPDDGTVQPTRTFTIEKLYELGFTQDEIEKYFTYHEGREVTRVDNGKKEFMNPFYTFETTTVYGQTITTPEKLIHILRNTAILNYDEKYTPPEYVGENPYEKNPKVEGVQLPPDDGANYTPPEYVGENPYEKNPKVEGAQLPPDDGANYTPPEYVGENPYEKNPKVEGAQLPPDDGTVQPTRTFTIEKLYELGFTQDEINKYFTYNEAREVTRVDNGKKEFIPPYYTFESTVIYDQTIDTIELLLHILRNTKKM